jgi:hypothetical protein
LGKKKLWNSILKEEEVVLGKAVGDGCSGRG